MKSIDKHTEASLKRFDDHSCLPQTEEKFTWRRLYRGFTCIDSFQIGEDI